MSTADTPEQRFREDARMVLKSLRTLRRRGTKMKRHPAAIVEHMEAYLQSALRMKTNRHRVCRLDNPFCRPMNAAEELRNFKPKG